MEMINIFMEIKHTKQKFHKNLRERPLITTQTKSS